MKLSYTTLSVQDRTIGEAVEIASAHGLEGIELRGRGDAGQRASINSLSVPI